ncbi:MAG: ribonuclease III [Lachnospiraceae bacterium]|nr:ribonuclease III [Lachnospiraceae bacterium]
MDLITEYEEKIGYEFKNKSLLEQAFIHSSFANETKLPPHSDNERLEFLGDAVLEVVSSDFLFRNYPDLPEGELTRMRAALVCESSLAESARELSLGKYLKLSIGEDKTGGRERPSVLSDAFEATIGAMYLDGGLENARSYIEKNVLTNIDDKILYFDSKTALQEVVQSWHSGALSYRVIDEEGPSHKKIFTVEALVGENVIGTGKGNSKKNAEQEAAVDALRALKEKGKI